MNTKISKPDYMNLFPQVKWCNEYRPQNMDIIIWLGIADNLPVFMYEEPKTSEQFYFKDVKYFLKHFELMYRTTGKGDLPEIGQIIQQMYSDINTAAEKLKPKVESGESEWETL